MDETYERRVENFNVTIQERVKAFQKYEMKSLLGLLAALATRTNGSAGRTGTDNRW